MKESASTVTTQQTDIEEKETQVCVSVKTAMTKSAYTPKDGQARWIIKSGLPF